MHALNTRNDEQDDKWAKKPTRQGRNTETINKDKRAIFDNDNYNDEANDSHRSLGNTIPVFAKTSTVASKALGLNPAATQYHVEVTLPTPRISFDRRGSFFCSAEHHNKAQAATLDYGEKGGTRHEKPVC